MQWLVHAVLIQIVKAYTFPFVTGRGKTTTHSSQSRTGGEGLVRKHPCLPTHVPLCFILEHPEDHL